MNIFMSKKQEIKRIAPENKLQRLAFMKGYRSAYEFGIAIRDAGIASYGMGHEKWDGKAGKTQYNTLLAISQFLGESSVEKVFDP